METTEIVEAVEPTFSTQEKIVLVASFTLIVAGVGSFVYRKLKARKAAGEEEQLWTEAEEASAQN